jgi:hypothetical protein
MSSTRLYWWRKQLEETAGGAVVEGIRTAEAASFVPVVVYEEPKTLEGAGVVVRLDGGCELEVADATRVDSRWVVEVVRGLSGGLL